MVFFKKIDVREMKLKYGETHHGLIALEPIKKGEAIWSCNCAEKDGVFTRDQLLSIIKQHPRLDYFVRSFSYMIDDDLYLMPLTYMEEKNNDECAFFNHSCEPNCGFSDAFGDNVIAVRDIAVGDELTYHYGILETESSLIYGLKCICNLSICCGRLTFDFYRNEDFVNKYLTV
jgi:SET domain-containing protein